MKERGGGVLERGFGRVGGGRGGERREREGRRKRRRFAEYLVEAWSPQALSCRRELKDGSGEEGEEGGRGARERREMKEMMDGRERRKFIPTCRNEEKEGDPTQMQRGCG